jgi:predicted enzyme related to lactoylglutathione lyase
VVDVHGRFVWYELMTTDVNAAMSFYAKVMGWRVWDASAPGRPYYLFRDGPAPVGGLMSLPEEARANGVKSSWLGYVGVDDVDATARRILQLGGAVHVPPTDAADVSRFSIISDPQAARLALMKWRKPGPHGPGERRAPGPVGWHELLAGDWESAWPFYGELFGWKTSRENLDEDDDYQSFSAGEEAIGGMVSKEPEMPGPCWLYYFNIGDIDATIARLEARGGKLVHAPHKAHGGSWIAQCIDPQGAWFALQGSRRADAPGYFERATARGHSRPPSNR